MKVLFLDLDGVVNSESSLKKPYRGIIGIDPYMAFMVGKIVLDTGAKIVLSTSWRGSVPGEEEIKQYIGDFIDRTPHVRGPRGYEIKSWLDKHPEVTRYAILDDENDMLGQQWSSFFKTEWEIGITEEIAKKVTQHLNA